MEPINREARSRPPPNSTQSRLLSTPLPALPGNQWAHCGPRLDVILSNAFYRPSFSTSLCPRGRKDQATRLPVVYFKVCRFFAATVGCCGNGPGHVHGLYWARDFIKGFPSWWVTSSTLVLFVMWNMI